MNSRAFYSFYVFVLLVFIALAVGKYFSRVGRDQHQGISCHIEMQMEMFANDLSQLTKACLRQYDLKQCQELSFELNGYQMQSFVHHCKNDVCILDVVIEYISPLSLLPLRYTNRTIWNLKNLKQSGAD